MAIRCGNRVHRDRFDDMAGVAHHHDTVAMVRLCFAREHGIFSNEEHAHELADEAEARAEYEADRDADVAYARYLENRFAHYPDERDPEYA
jgi:hypothetical protein